MALEKRIVYRQRLNEFGEIWAYRVEQLFENGEFVSEVLFNHLIRPGDDTKNEDAVTKEIAKAVHTQEVISAHEARVLELETE